jgi:hypothetical protein
VRKIIRAVRLFFGSKSLRRDVAAEMCAIAIDFSHGGAGGGLANWQSGTQA